MRYVLAAVLLSTRALAQEGYIGHDHHKWHQDFYQHLVRPDNEGTVLQSLRLPSDFWPSGGRPL